MDSFIKDHPDETNVVILLQFAKCHWFQGEPYVSNSFDVSRLWIDGDIDEISLYKSSLLGIGADNSSISQQSIVDSIISSGPSIEDDFLKNTCFCFISDIHDLTEAKSVIILGTIKGIDKDIKWFYEACSKCFKKAVVSDDKTHIECSNQNCHTLERSLIIRYKIPLRVQDSTGTVTITMFDRDARKFLGISAQNLLQDNNQFVGEEIIPKQFDMLMDRKFAFKIQVKDFNLNKNVGYYTISRITEDESVISNLDQKFDEQESPPNESVNFPLGKIELTATMSIKTLFPLLERILHHCRILLRVMLKKDLAASTSESPDCLVTGVKRNLSNVYDLDDNSSPFPGKSRSSEKTTAAQKLIVPKVEK